MGALVALTGCGGESADEPAAPRSATVVIDQFEFMPPQLTVKQGAKVTFDNRDTAGHTATSDKPDVFDTGSLPKARSTVVMLEDTGTIAYHCDFHPTMKAEITVE